MFKVNKILYPLICIVFGSILFSSVYVQLPTTPLTSNVDTAEKDYWTRLYPQGWQFFTKNTSDPEVTIYKVNGKNLENISRFPNSRVDNWFGFKRLQRSQGTEVGTLSLQVNSWRDCNETPEEDCLIVSIADKPQVVKNKSNNPTICGDAIILLTKPVPWGFREDYIGWRLDDSAVHLDIKCENE